MILLVGSNAAETHPILFHHIMKGVHRGAELIVVDPRRTATARKAREHVQLAVGTDIALVNAMIHVIIREGLWHRAFVERATDGYEELKAQVASWTPERAAAICGVPPAQIERVARTYAQADRAMIAWTLGITEHHNAVDHVLALINLALLTGHVGRPGTGLNPLRGQNNVQGGGDMGALPDRLPGFYSVRDAAARQRFEAAWGVTLSERPGLNQSQIFEAMREGRVQGLYVIGENPLVSEANSQHIAEAFARLRALIVQDVVMTATAARADVVFPARVSFAESTGTYTNSERRVQLVRAARQAPGEARDDLWILAALARELGHAWPEVTAAEVFAEIRAMVPTYRGITYQRLENTPGIQWPCPDENHPGTPVLHTRLWDEVVTPRVAFHPVEWVPPAEPLDDAFPFRLTTGRRLQSFNSGVQSRHYGHPAPEHEWLEIHPRDAQALGLEEGRQARVVSRRGSLTVPVRLTSTVPPGTVFLSFHFPDQTPTNVLSIDATDVVSGTAEFKAAAVRIERVEE